MAAAIRRGAGRSLKVRAFPWALLWLLAPFGETLREMV